MKASLHENQLECYRPVYTGQKSFALSGETVVPDKLPDIGLLGETNACIFLHAKRTEQGVGTMEGDLEADVCYLSDGAGGFQRLTISIPWSVQFESESIAEGEMAVGEVQIQALETRMVNPRKVLVKAQLAASFTVYEKKTVTLCDGMDENPKVQIRRESVQANLIGTVCEKTFVATDEYPLPGDLIGGEILHKSVQFRVDDVKTLANKLIVKGSVASDVVVASAGGSAERVSFTSSFSFIAETDCEAVSPEVQSTVMATGAYVELSADGRVLSVEIHGVCQMVSYQKREITYLSDAYSNFCECETEYRPISVCQNLKSSLLRDTSTVTLPGRSQVARVLYVTVGLRGAVNTQTEAQLPMTVCACVQYENGTQDYLKKQLNGTFSLKEGGVLACARVTDVHSTGSGTEVEVRIQYEGEVWECSESRLDTISAIDLDEEHPCCQVRPTITVVRTGGSLWELAKRYASTVDFIRKFNQLEEDTVPPDTILLIPKQSL